MRSVPAISSPFSPFFPLALLIDFLRVLPLQFLLQDERRGGKKENPAAAQNRCTKTVGSQCFRTYSIGAGKKRKIFLMILAAAAAICTDGECTKRKGKTH